MNIEGVSKIDLLVALHARAKFFNMGFVQEDPEAVNISPELAKILIENGLFQFEYIHGKLCKIDLSGNEVDTTKYNADNGPEAAEKVLADLKKKKA